MLSRRVPRSCCLRVTSCGERLTGADSLDPGQQTSGSAFLRGTEPAAPGGLGAELQSRAHPESQRWAATQIPDLSSLGARGGVVPAETPAMETLAKQAKSDSRVPAPPRCRRGARVCWPHSARVAGRVINKLSSLPPFLLPPPSECSVCGFFSLWKPGLA